MRKATFLIILTALSFCGIAFLYLLSAFYEPQSLAQNSISARIFIPSDIRAVPISQECRQPVYSRSFQECGGICGEYYSIDFASDASTETLQSTYGNLAAELGVPQNDVFISIASQGESDACRDVSITVYYMYESAVP